MNHLSDVQPIAVFDVETTGLSPAYGDRICEVGIVRARGDVIFDTYQTLVNPQRPISPGAARVNGLSDADVSQSPLFAEIAGQVLDRLEGAVLVCHNAPFDLGFLDAELSRLGLLARLASSALAPMPLPFRSNSLSAWLPPAWG
jgi:DNA polymerase-3 subunit epsilon